MIDRSPTVRLVGVRNPGALDEHFASSMVDVAYVHRIDADTVDLLLDSTDVRKADDREWISGILRNILRACGEEQTEIQFLVDLQS